MIAVFHRANGVPILRVLYLNAAVYVRQPDVCATCPNLSTQVMSDKSVMIDVQSKIVADAARDGARLHLGIRVGRNR